MSAYRLELRLEGVGEHLELRADDDNAARRQALLALSDLLRDRAILGVYEVHAELKLFDGDDALIHLASVVAE